MPHKDPDQLAAYRKAYYAANRERLLAHKRSHYEQNPELYREKNRIQFEKHKPKIKAHRREHYQQNRGRILAADRNYRIENRAEVVARQRARYWNDPDKYREQKRRSYEKNRERMIAEYNTPQGRAKAKAYREKWLATNRGLMRQWQRDWRENPENRARLLRWAKEHRKKNLAAYRERDRLAKKAERSTNPEKVCAREIEKANRYRANRIAAAIGTDREAYKAFVRAVRSAIRITCYWCGDPAPKGKRHIDHIIPVTKGGADDVLNLCCACQACNCSKNNKMPEEFSGQFELFAKTA